MHDVHGGLVCMLCVGFVCMMCVGLVCLMCAHQMCVVRSKLLCVCKHGVIILFLRMHCVSACMLGECVCVCRLAKLVFAAVHVFCVRMYVDYLVLVVSAVCVSEICMHDVCWGLYA